MGWLSGAMKMTKSVMKSPIGSMAMKFGKAVPFLGTGLAAVDIGMSAMDMMKGSGGGGSAGLPALPPAPGFGGNSMRGPGGALQMPGFGASTSAGGGAHTLDDRYLKICYRAPRGYVVMWDGGAHGVGKPFAVLKRDAKNMRYPNGSRVFHTHHKPPISVGDWHAFKRSHSVVKKLMKVEKEARHIAAFARRVGPHHHAPAIAHHKKGK